LGALKGSCLSSWSDSRLFELSSSSDDSFFSCSSNSWRMKLCFTDWKSKPWNFCDMKSSELSSSDSGSGFCLQLLVLWILLKCCARWYFEALVL
jgi:hypothetical protein